MGMSLPGNILLPARHLEIVIVMETNKPWYKAVLVPMKSVICIWELNSRDRRDAAQLQNEL